MTTPGGIQRPVVTENGLLSLKTELLAKMAETVSMADTLKAFCGELQFNELRHNFRKDAASSNEPHKKIIGVIS